MAAPDMPEVMSIASSDRHDCDQPPGQVYRDSPDESQTGINVRVFLQDRREVADRYSTSGNPNAWSRAATRTTGSHLHGR
jgi:hypothetical protein